MKRAELFQSTHPLRDATFCFTFSRFRKFYFNPRTPYGMRQERQVQSLSVRQFQSTHPLRDATILGVETQPLQAVFQSTHPLRDATCEGISCSSISNISIHAPLTGCDRNNQYKLLTICDFNPRTPYGMRHGNRTGLTGGDDFNPRTPYGMRL